jgi:hypothetical protein
MTKPKAKIKENVKVIKGKKKPKQNSIKKTVVEKKPKKVVKATIKTKEKKNVKVVKKTPTKNIKSKLVDVKKKEVKSQDKKVAEKKVEAKQLEETRVDDVFVESSVKAEIANNGVYTVDLTKQPQVKELIVQFKDGNRKDVTLSIKNYKQ